MFLRLFYNCLRVGHSSKMCKSQRTCFICSLLHHSSLCNRNSTSQNQSNTNNSSASRSMRNHTSSVSNGSQHQQQSNTQHKPTVTLNKSNTAKTPASSPTQVHMTNVNSTRWSSLTNNVLPTATFDLCYQQQKLSTRAFFNTSSQRSFVSPKIVKRLNLPLMEKVLIEISTFVSDSSSFVLDLVRVKIQFGRRRIPVKLLVHDQASWNCTVLDCIK